MDKGTSHRNQLSKIIDSVPEILWMDEILLLKKPSIPDSCVNTQPTMLAHGSFGGANEFRPSTVWPHRYLQRRAQKPFADASRGKGTLGKTSLGLVHGKLHANEPHPRQARKKQPGVAMFYVLSPVGGHLEDQSERDPLSGAMLVGGSKLESLGTTSIHKNGLRPRSHNLIKTW